MSDWRRSPMVAGICAALFVVIQLSLVVSRAGGDTPQRFGWQMYSETEPAPDFVVTTSTEDIEIDLADYMAAVRAEVDFERFAPPHLCHVTPGAIEVTWDSGFFQC